MSISMQLLSSRSPGGDQGVALREFLETCADCELACVACADACLGEAMLDQLRQCIRACMESAEVTASTLRLLAGPGRREPELVRAQLQTCQLAVGACRTECSHHATMHEHCRLCEEACTRCERAARRLLATVTADDNG
jgi:hypothetical protein